MAFAATRLLTLRRLLIALFALPLLLGSQLVVAQDSPIDQGVYILDGSAFFRSQGGELYTGINAGEDRQTTITFQPAALYMVAPRFAVGGQLRLSRSSQDTGTSTTLGIGPSATYYLGEPDSELLPFVGANLLLLRQNTSSDAGIGIGEQTVNLTGVAFDAKAGFTYMLARNVGVTTAAFFLYERLGGDALPEAQTGNTLGVQVGITAFIF